MEIRGRAAVSHRWSESAPDVGVLQQPSSSGFSGPPGRQWLSFISRLHRTTKWPFYDHFLSALFAVQGNKKKKIPVWQRPLQRSLTRRLNFITPNNFFMTRPGNCGQHVIPVQGLEKKKRYRNIQRKWRHVGIFMCSADSLDAMLSMPRRPSGKVTFSEEKFRRRRSPESRLH